MCNANKANIAARYVALATMHGSDSESRQIDQILESFCILRAKEDYVDTPDAESFLALQSKLEDYPDAVECILDMYITINVEDFMERLASPTWKISAHNPQNH